VRLFLKNNLRQAQDPDFNLQYSIPRSHTKDSSDEKKNRKNRIILRYKRSSEKVQR
jgi:hypothetical protein